MDWGIYELIMSFLVFIVVFVRVSTLFCMKAVFCGRSCVEGALVEFVWTVLPLRILIVIMVPRFYYL